MQSRESHLPAFCPSWALCYGLRGKEIRRLRDGSVAGHPFKQKMGLSEWFLLKLKKKKK